MGTVRGVTEMERRRGATTEVKARAAGGGREAEAGKIFEKLVVREGLKMGKDVVGGG